MGVDLILLDRKWHVKHFKTGSVCEILTLDQSVLLSNMDALHQPSLQYAISMPCGSTIHQRIP